MNWSRKINILFSLICGVLILALVNKMFPRESEDEESGTRFFLGDWIGENVICPMLGAEIEQMFPSVAYAYTGQAESVQSGNWKEEWADRLLGRIVPITGMADEHEDTSLKDWGKKELSLREWGSTGENAVVSGSQKPVESVDAETESPEGNAGQEDPDSEEVFLSMPAMQGKLYTAEELADPELTKSFYVITSSTKIYNSDFDGEVLMNKDLTMKQDNSRPQILVYHTHSQEGYADSVEGNESTGVVGVGEYLTELLRQYGYNVIHMTDQFDVVDGVTDRNYAYERAYVRLAEVLKENPSIEVVLDIHRDGVSEGVHLATEVNGRQTAKVMFFNGMSRIEGVSEEDYPENPYLEDNLAMSLQMKCLGMAYFPGFTRPNFIREYNYNMGLRAKSMLIEVGAQTNTYEEAKNAMIPLAMLLHEVLQ